MKLVLHSVVPLDPTPFSLFRLYPPSIWFENHFKELQTASQQTRTLELIVVITTAHR